MKRSTKDVEKSPHGGATSDYKDQLYHLQVQLVKVQNHVIRKGLKILVVFEGCDGVLPAIRAAPE